MRIAHIIMAHKDPEQLARLIRSLQHPKSDFYLHIDAKVSLHEFEKLTAIPNVNLIKTRIDCNWGGFSFVRAIFNALTEVLDKTVKYSHVNLLSGQDYPVYNSDYIYNFLGNNLSNSFISYDTSSASPWWSAAKSRYQKYHFTDVKMKGKYVLQKIVNAVAPLRKFPQNLNVYGSSDSSWWTITGDCASYITKKFNSNRELSSFLRYCWGTDEFVIATLIMNSPFKDQVINNNLRYIDWSEGHAHPKILTIEDLGKITNSKMLFARKFDMNIDIEILNALD